MLQLLGQSQLAIKSRTCSEAITSDQFEIVGQYEISREVGAVLEHATIIVCALVGSVTVPVVAQFPQCGWERERAVQSRAAIKGTTPYLCYTLWNDKRSGEVVASIERIATNGS